MLEKKLFLIVTKITIFFTVNSNNQELTHLILCFGYTYYHQSKANKSYWFHEFIFHDIYFESYSSNVSNIFHSIKHLYISYDLSQQHFYSQLLFLYPHDYHLLNMITYLALIQQILQLQHQVFHLFFRQPLFCLNYHNILT